MEPLSLTGAIVSGNTQGHFGNGKIQIICIKTILWVPDVCLHLWKYSHKVESHKVESAILSIAPICQTSVLNLEFNTHMFCLDLKHKSFVFLESPKVCFPSCGVMKRKSQFYDIVTCVQS